MGRVVSKHRWATYGDRPDWDEIDLDTDHLEVDHFAGVSEGFHNGPLCLDCGLTECEHGRAVTLDEECPKSTVAP